MGGMLACGARTLNALSGLGGELVDSAACMEERSLMLKFNRGMQCEQ